MYLGGNGLNCEVEFVDATTVIYHNGDARVMKQGGLREPVPHAGRVRGQLAGRGVSPRRGS